MYRTGGLNVQQMYVKMFHLTIGNATKETIPLGKMRSLTMSRVGKDVE